jgi:putative nucleotidyltransferase with HDIG domain
MRETPTVTPAGTRRQLPIVLAATAACMLVPLGVVVALAGLGVGATPVLAAAALIAALAVRRVVHEIWRRRPQSRELPAADLMLWRWLRRQRLERQLEEAVAQLGADPRTLPVDRDPAEQMEVIKGLAAALEARDPYTHGHSRRVARYSTMIAQGLDLPEEQVRKIRTAAVVHDVGKLAVPLEVLNKPGRLTDEEFEVIKTHAPRGAEMVSRLGDPELTDMVAHHHERLDGTGYPARIGGESIPLGARIIAVADTFDALTSTRPYRAAKRDREALRILRAEAGTQLDPRAVRAFDRCYNDSFHGLLAWPLLAGLPHRIWAPLESQLQAATGTMTAKVATIVATTAATGVIPATGIQADPRDTNRMPGDEGAAIAKTMPSGHHGGRTLVREAARGGPGSPERSHASARPGPEPSGAGGGDGSAPEPAPATQPSAPPPAAPSQAPAPAPEPTPADSGSSGPVGDLVSDAGDAIDETVALAPGDVEEALPVDAGEVTDALGNAPGPLR